MLSWRESIIGALARLGGEGPYEEIYAEVAAQRSSLPPSWQAVIRRTIQQSSSDSKAFRPSNGDIFRAVSGIGKGVWGLRSESPGVGLELGVAEPSASGQGYVVNSAVRRAIEAHAVRVAAEHYVARGAYKVEEFGKPYDLCVHFADLETHVEVKGSTRRLNAVTLTRNEVVHARQTAGTELVVVDEIALSTKDSGVVETEGGRVRLWTSWAPSDSSLTPTVFLHDLDDEQGVLVERRK